MNKNIDQQINTLIDSDIPKFEESYNNVLLSLREAIDKLREVANELMS
jgi:hypothetical protein